MEESDFTIIDNTREAQDEYGHNYGSETNYITLEDIHALLQGKQLACDINGNEYSLFIKMSDKELKTFKMLKEISGIL